MLCCPLDRHATLRVPWGYQPRVLSRLHSTHVQGHRQVPAVPQALHSRRPRGSVKYAQDVQANYSSKYRPRFLLPSQEALSRRNYKGRVLAFDQDLFDDRTSPLKAIPYRQGALRINS